LSVGVEAGLLCGAVLIVPVPTFCASCCAEVTVAGGLVSVNVTCPNCVGAGAPPVGVPATTARFGKTAPTKAVVYDRPSGTAAKATAATGAVTAAAGTCPGFPGGPLTASALATIALPLCVPGVVPVEGGGTAGSNGEVPLETPTSEAAVRSCAMAFCVGKARNVKLSGAPPAVLTGTSWVFGLP